jgi:hypothetical protein
MPWPYTKDEIIDTLVGKFAFEQDDRDHDYYVLELDGRSAAYTFVSRGHRDRVTPNIARMMTRQMRLNSLQQFRDAVDCPLTAEDYYAQLRAQRTDGADAEPDDPELPYPRQPLRWLWSSSGRSFGYLEDARLHAHDGRHIATANVLEELFTPDGQYLGEVRDYSTLVVIEQKVGVVTCPAFAPQSALAAIRQWNDRKALPLEEGVRHFPDPASC